jgi:Tfp pilus assembly protein PilO
MKKWFILILLLFSCNLCLADLTITKNSGDTIKISVPIVQVRTISLRQLKLDKESIEQQIADLQQQLKEIDSLILEAEKLGVKDVIEETK